MIEDTFDVDIYVSTLKQFTLLCYHHRIDVCTDRYMSHANINSYVNDLILCMGTRHADQILQSAYVAERLSRERRAGACQNVKMVRTRAGPRPRRRKRTRRGSGFSTAETLLKAKV